MAFSLSRLRVSEEDRSRLEAAKFVALKDVCVVPDEVLARRARVSLLEARALRSRVLAAVCPTPKTVRAARERASRNRG